MTRKISTFAVPRSAPRFVGVAASGAVSAVSRLVRAGSAFGAAATGRVTSPSYRLWDPTLLDRLHVPLTRHHE